MSNTNDPQAPYSRLSDCCGEEIHHGHCTKCEKPCGIKYVHASHNDIVYPEDTVSNKPTERAPLLTPEEIDAWADDAVPDDWPEPVTLGDMRDKYIEGADRASAYFLAKITSGELRVVERATLIPRNGMKCCSLCDYRYEFYEELAPEPGDFCRCGAQIVKV